MFYTWKITQCPIQECITDEDKTQVQYFDLD